ncbi:MAG TPA: tRNA (adenosine(37)-N6)-threonylcarbamoyltransferase complex ATPase subunit type 1 TsaE [Thermoanaerobaculia bacterium]
MQRAEGLTRERLEEWGHAIGANAARPLVIGLSGPLGAGKSVLARAIARGAGVAGAMPSPTFNLVYRYEPAAGLEVGHLDLYRLEDPDEVWELGWRELGEGNQIVLVEWPERAEGLMTEPRWDVELALEDDPDRRTVVVTRVGDAPELPALPGADAAAAPGPASHA